jgi:diguanylate cyclase (GGDEF)-like protein/PAS domain S-box-containing protein
MAPVRDSAGRIVDFTYIDANESACASVGVTYGHLIGSRLLEHYPDASATGLLTEYVNVIATGRSLSLDDWAHPMADGLHYFDVRAVRVGDDLSHTWRDVSDRQAAMARLAASEAKYRLLAENATDIIFRIRGNAIEWVSPSIVNALGWPPEEVTGKDLRVLVHEADLPDVDAFDEALATGLTMTLRLRVRARDGTFHWVECHAKPYLDDTGVPDGIAASVHVVDSEVAAEQDLQWRVRHDELTGLVNRREALDRIGALRSHRQRRPGPDDGVLFCDVDSFKSLNDAHGHAVGDAILRSLSGRISASVRDGDLVARLGGDEFLIVLAGIHGLDEATLLAEGIRAAAAEPIVIGSHQIAATVSIGVTLAGAGESADSLIARADRAMYRAKQEGRNQTVTIAPN